MSDIDFAAIRGLAKLAREDTFRQGWPYGGSGEWTENVIGMLGGATGDFAGAMSPDVVVRLLDRVDELEAKVERVQALCDNAPHIRDPWEDDWKGEQVVPVDQLRAALAAVPAAGEETT